MAETTTGVVIGAGDRGAHAYVPLLLAEPELGRIVGVAEHDPGRRTAFAQRFALPADACFASASELLAKPRFADFALIATQDADHVAPALAALDAGYHVLLEKPMAVDEEDCERLLRASEHAGKHLQICHVLRHAPLYRAVADVIASGELGEVVTIQHAENVSYWHYAHSYCRGAWRNRAASSPMILAKSCHDLDLLYWFAGAPPERLTSVERPTQLSEANLPEGAPGACIEGCPHSESCPYDAVAMYRDVTPLLLDLRMRSGVTDADVDTPKADGWTFWPVSVITEDTSAAGVEHALRHGRYGRCVYRIGDNDQPSSQSVAIRFANGVNANFTLHTTSYREGRQTRIDGTRGSLVAGFYNAEQHLTVHDHKTGTSRDVALEGTARRHGCADPELLRGFLAAVRGERAPETSAAESIWSHRMAFAADRCAREGTVARW